MSIVFPLTLAAFFDRLPVQDVRLPPPVPGRQINNLAGGEILAAEVSPALWEGSVTLAPMRAREAEGLVVLLALLEVPGRSFEVRRANQIGPAGDPLGTTLGASSVTISGFDLEASTLDLAGLPAGYQLAPGDQLSFGYDASPVRQALHLVAAPGTANGSGALSGLVVAPHLRAGLAVAAPVQLVRPFCRAVLVPGSVNYGVTRNGITSAVQFGFRQSVRF